MGTQSAPHFCISLKISSVAGSAWTYKSVSFISVAALIVIQDGGQKCRKIALHCEFRSEIHLMDDNREKMGMLQTESNHAWRI